MTEIDDIEYLYDTLFIEVFHKKFNLWWMWICNGKFFFFFKDRFKKTLPEWTKKYFPVPMKELSDFSFKMKAYNLEMQRLRGGNKWVTLYFHVIFVL
jgi:lysosomal acid phosphatase